MGITFMVFNWKSILGIIIPAFRTTTKVINNAPKIVNDVEDIVNDLNKITDDNNNK